MIGQYLLCTRQIFIHKMLLSQTNSVMDGEFCLECTTVCEVRWHFSLIFEHIQVLELKRCFKLSVTCLPDWNSWTFVPRNRSQCWRIRTRNRFAYAISDNRVDSTQKSNIDRDICFQLINQPNKFILKVLFLKVKSITWSEIECHCNPWWK